MIKLEKFFDGAILNMSGAKASRQHTMMCTWLERCEADVVHSLWAFPTDREITHTELIDRAQQIVKMVEEKGDIKAVWLRPLRQAPFFYTYVEDALLTNGYAVVYPASELVINEHSERETQALGWWVNPPFTEEELEDD